MTRTIKTVLFMLAGVACSILMMSWVNRCIHITWMDWYQEIIAHPTWNGWSLFLPIALIPAVISFTTSIGSSGFGESLMKFLTVPLVIIPVTVIGTLVFGLAVLLIDWIVESIRDGSIGDKMAAILGTIVAFLILLLTPVRRVVAVILFRED